MTAAPWTNLVDRHRGFILPPSLAEVEALAQLDHLELSPSETAAIHKTVSAIVEAAARAEAFEQPRRALQHTHRDPGHAPSAGEDPYNAFIRKCRVEGAAHGPLAGLTLALKDNISVAGVPTTNGSRLPAYVPTEDAVVVERILAAGGTVVGKLNMDDYGGGATGVMSAFGPARNPVAPTRSAGGSSGGSAAALRSGAVDLALGVDQGGSGRIPASFCGVVAAKATHGLVPSFGVTHIDHTVDFITPMARTVHQTALLLEVIAGDDWRDAQWVRGPITTAPYTRASADGVRGLRVAVLEESLSGVECDPAVTQGVEAAAEALAAAGAVVGRVSLPIWRIGFAVFQPLVAHLIANMVRSEGEGYGHLGAIDVGRMHAFAVARRAQSRDLNPYVKCWMIADKYLHERYLNVTYGKLQNLRLEIRRQIMAQFNQYDLLLTPTTPNTAPRLFETQPSFEELLGHSAAAIAYNTAPLNLSGNPALSVPSGADADGLPTAVQIIGRHFDEYTAFRAAFVLEQKLGPFGVG